jgi:hypothetical protein
MLVCVALAPIGAQQQSPAFDFSSVLFGNFQMRTDAAARATTGGEPANRFDIGRAYLTFRFPAGDRASVRITTDIFQQSNAASSAFYPGWAVRLKYGYLQYDVTRSLAGIDGLGMWARVGMLQTVVIEHIESFWPRWMGNSAVEQAGFFSSADAGASTQLTLPSRRGELYVTVTNGPGYANPENDRFKDVAARFTLTPFANDSGWLRTFAITPWYSKGWLASPYAQSATPVSDGLRKDRRGLFVGLRERRLTLGAEIDQRLEELETTTPPAPRGALAERTSQLMSGFAIVRPLELFGGRRSPLSLIGRYDRFEIDSDADAFNEFLVGGVMWDLTQRVTLALDYQSSTPRSGAAGTPMNTWFLHWVATF